MKIGFWPYLRLQWISPLPAEVIAQRLSEHVEERRFFRFIRDLRFLHAHRPFEGVVTATHFRIQRVIRYQNSALPIVRGRFISLNDTTLVDVELAPHIFALTFFGGWSLVVMTIGTAVAAREISSDGTFYSLAFMFFMLVVAYLILIIVFSCEVKPTMRLFATVLADQQTTGTRSSTAKKREVE